MNKALRKAVIAGNWKMNKTPAEAVELVKGLIPLVKDAKCDVVVCPTAASSDWYSTNPCG